MLFWSLAITFIAIEAYGYTGFSPFVAANSFILLQVQALIACSCGAMCAAKPTPKRKYGVIVLFLCFLSVCIIDWFQIPMTYTAKWVEVMFYSLLMAWAIMRPYEFMSDKLTKDTVCILFYKANSGTMFMHLFSLVGLPVSSMSIVAGDKWLKLVHGEPLLTIKSAYGIEKSKYVIIDTGVPVCEGIEYAIEKIKGAPARSGSSLWLRLRCIASVRPLLAIIGRDWEPKNIFEQMPSIYFNKAVRLRNRRGWK